MDSFDSLAKAGIARTPRVIEVETAVARHLRSRGIWSRCGTSPAPTFGKAAEPKLYTYSQVMAWVGIDRFLMDGGLVRRKTPSDEGPDEGAFLVCSC